MGDRNEHPRESALELYVLGSDTLSDADQDAIERHIESCAGCRDLVDTMEEFYGELRTELGKFDSSLPVISPEELPLKVNQTIGARRGDRPAIHEVDPRLPFRAARWVVKHPVAAAAGTLLSFGLLAWLILLSVPAKTTDEVTDFNPAIVEMRGITLVAKNRYGQEVGEVVSGIELSRILQRDRTVFDKKVRLVDVDGDGRNELLWTERRTEATNSGYMMRCMSFHPDRGLWTFPITGGEKHEGSPEWNSARYTILEIRPILSRVKGTPDVYMLLSSNLFPAQIVRIDARTGMEISRYYHPGALNPMEVADLDGDSLPEIIAGGMNNAFNDAVVVVLDPAGVSGRAPDGGRYAIRDVPPANEMAYIRIPRTIVGLADPANSRDRVTDIILNPENRSMSVSVKDDPEATVSNPDFHITFRRDLSIDLIEPGDGYRAVADSLFSAGIIHRKADRKYLNEYTKQISWWDGDRWVHHATWNLKNTDVARRKAVARSPGKIMKGD
jgi:hypothetical protein